MNKLKYNFPGTNKKEVCECSIEITNLYLYEWSKLNTLVDFFFKTCKLEQKLKKNKNNLFLNYIDKLFDSRLAFGQFESYSMQPRLPLAATIGPARRSRVLSPARILDGMALLYSSELSYSSVVIHILSCNVFFLYFIL